MTNIQKTEAFLKEQFANCAFFKEHPADGEYRLQHSYRVALTFTVTKKKILAIRLFSRLRRDFLLLCFFLYFL